MSFSGNISLFPLSTEDEEEQLRLAILESLQDFEISTENCRESASSSETSQESEHNSAQKSQEVVVSISTATTSRPRPMTRAKTTTLFSTSPRDLTDESSQTMLRRSMSIGNESPPRPTFLTDCCEVTKAIAVKNREYIRCLVAQWGRVTSPIHSAVLVGHQNCLASLLKAFPDLINSVNTKGETPLYLSSVHSNEIALNQLLQSGADPNIGRNIHETPLLAAVDNDCLSVVRSLTKGGADVNRPLNRGWTAIHEAVYRGHIAVLETLLQKGGNPNIRDIFGISPLFTSAACGRNDCLRMLLQSGGDPNMCAKSKSASPLYEACKEGHLDCVVTLLDNGANPHLVNCDGLYPIHIAAFQGYKEIVEKLLPITEKKAAESCGMSPVHSAAKGDNIDILKILIRHGYDVNIKLTKEKITYRDRRQTALFFAVYNDSEEATEILLQAGAQTELDYVKPLLIAISHSQYDMAELLLSYGADVNACFVEDGALFPATVAFALRDFTMLKQILVAGCDVKKCFSCKIGNEDHTRYTDDVRRTSFCHFVTEDHQRSWCGFTVHYLLQFVGNVKLCHQILNAVQESDEWQDIKEFLEKPRRLLHLCRLRIRDAVDIRAAPHDKVFQKLPIPDPMKRYLTFKEI